MGQSGFQKGLSFRALEGGQRFVTREDAEPADQAFFWNFARRNTASRNFQVRALTIPPRIAHAEMLNYLLNSYIVLRDDGERLDSGESIESSKNVRGWSGPDGPRKPREYLER